MTKVSEILELANRINQCQSKFEGLFAGFDGVDKQLEQVQQIHNYFLQSTATPQLVTEYENLVNQMEKVRTGTIRAEQAIQYINNLRFSRKMSVILNNIAKTCEALFWTTLSIVEVSAEIALAILCILDPEISLMIIKYLVPNGSVKQMLRTFNEFMGFKPINNEHHLETDIISFFATQAQSTQVADSDQNGMSIDPTLDTQNDEHASKPA